MYDMDDRRSAGPQHFPQERPSTLPVQISVTIEYWVTDEAGSLANPDRIAQLPGSEAASSPYRVAIEIPFCDTSSTLQTTLVDQLETTVAAAHTHGCRLVALGVRPDLLAQMAETDQSHRHPTAATAGTRVSFRTTPADATDHYNCLLALDPAFALVNTTSWVRGDIEYACGRPSFYCHEQQPEPYRTSISTSTARDSTNFQTDFRAWQPVEVLDGGSTIEWRSLDATTPTLLVDLIADVKQILQTASQSRLEIKSFGNGCYTNRLLLPSTQWRAMYTKQAVRKGLSSLLVRAYLERLGFDTDWYLAATPPTVGTCSPVDRPAICSQRARQLEAELGVPLTN
jgi:hypothetical protein